MANSSLMPKPFARGSTKKQNQKKLFNIIIFCAGREAFSLPPNRCFLFINHSSSLTQPFLLRLFLSLSLSLVWGKNRTEKNENPENCHFKRDKSHSRGPFDYNSTKRQQNSARENIAQSSYKRPALPCCGDGSPLPLLIDIKTRSDSI